jgi:Salmonella virulence plasmid 65kDa B protein
MRPSRLLPLLSAMAGALSLLPGTVKASDNKALELLTPFAGSLSQSISLQVPAFRGLEPRLGLGYSSEAGNGFAGVGWGLGGVSVIQRAGPGRGTPHYDANDIYLFGGQELLTCPTPVASVSCSNGGTHSTRNESYTKILKNGETWTIWSPDGTRTILTPIYTIASGTFRWGETSRVDTHGNTVTYTWVSASGDSYLDTVSYGPYSVKLYRETRSDTTSFTIGDVGSLGQTLYRLRSVLVAYGGAPIRAYKLTYQTSAATGRSRLTAVQQYGKDVAIDSGGLITGGTSLPPRTFVYQDDANAHSFRSWPND